MLKFFVGLLMIGLLAFIGYMQWNSEPLSPRTSIEQGIKQAKEKTTLSPEQEMLLKVQLAISDYMASNGTAPGALTDLVPKYFDQEPKNPVTGESFPYKREGKIPKLGAQLTAKVLPPKDPKGPTSKTEDDLLMAAKDGFVNPNTMQIDEFVYDRTGKRDPFEPFDYSATPGPSGGSSLTGYSLGQLRLAAVIVGPTGEKKGIVEDSTGRGYTVAVGMAIGNEGGTVASIETDRIKVVVNAKDFTGKETQSISEMKINQSGPSGQKKPPKVEKKK